MTWHLDRRPSDNALVVVFRKMGRLPAYQEWMFDLKELRQRVQRLREGGFEHSEDLDALKALEEAIALEQGEAKEGV